MSVTTQHATLSSLPDGTAISTTVGDGGLVQVVQAGALPLPAGASTEATLAAIKAKTDNLDVLLSTRTKPADVQAVSGPLTDTQLRATAVPVSTGLTQALTDTQLRASAVPVSGPLTDTQLRATAVPVSTGLTPLTDTQLRATPVPVSGPLTDTQLRATSVPVSTGLSQPLTDTQLRASAVPISMATNTPDVTDRAGRLLGVTSDANIDVALSTRLKPADTLAKVSVVDTITNPLPAGTNLIGQAMVPPATLVVTAVSATGGAITATLPSVAGQFHYISRIEIVRVSTAAVAGTAVLTYTSTNLPGSWARSAGNAIAAGGTVKDVDECLGSELKSSVAATNTAIVAAAAGTGVFTRITVYYRTAA